MSPDEQEAQSLKYISPRVAPLSSGAFAVFGPFSNEEGLPLLSICTTIDDLREAMQNAMNSQRTPRSRPKATVNSLKDIGL